MAISQALKEIYSSAPAQQRYIETLAFSHSLFPRTYYLTNDNVAWQFTLESGATVTFQAVPFAIILPKLEGNGNQDMNLTISNIGRDLIDPLELANGLPTEAVKCTYRVFLDQPLGSPQNTPVLELIITGVEVTKNAVSATATRADVLSRAFPYNFYRASQFPGLKR
jgi:hypothetical protein